MKKILTAVLFLALAGCMATYDKSLFFIADDVWLNSIVSDSYVRESDGHTLVQVTGTASHTQTVYYKVEWYDANGMKVKSALSKWQQKKLVKGIEFTIEAVSPSPKAVRYKVSMAKDLGNGILN